METRIIVIDDDPTGSQAVHSCLLLTQWDPDTLESALLDPSPLFFILGNTRGMSEDRAAEVTREICRNVRTALERRREAGAPVQPLVVSRSDSTLRGHYPAETDVIAEELGPFDAHFLVPAFLEGGRITRNSIHYVRQNGIEVPVHETEFARDSVFAYHHSYLPDYVAEKTGGRIRPEEVLRLTLEEVRGGTLSTLLSLRDNACVVVDAEQQEDLDRFSADVRAAVAQGKRFLFRSAASLLASLAALPPQPVSPETMGKWVRGGKPGVVLVGSHVQRTTEQLRVLLREPGLASVEIPVDGCTGPDREALRASVLHQVEQAHARGLDVVLQTSREERLFPTREERLAFGEAVSAFLMEIVRRLPEDLGFLVSKGGITSNDVLSAGLALHQSRVLGQIVPGCSLVHCPASHPRFPGLPVVIFPGNVGDADALAEVLRRLRSSRS